MKRTIKVYVSDDEYAVIDHARGRRSVSEYVASAAIEKALTVPPVILPATMERSCFTCSLCPADTAGDNCEPEMRGREGVHDYLARSGTHDSVNGMPTDRSIACPGWAAKGGE